MPAQSTNSTDHTAICVRAPELQQHNALKPRPLLGQRPAERVLEEPQFLERAEAAPLLWQRPAEAVAREVERREAGDGAQLRRQRPR